MVRNQSYEIHRNNNKIWSCRNKHEASTSFVSCLFILKSASDLKVFIRFLALCTKKYFRFEGTVARKDTDGKPYQLCLLD